MGDAAVVFADGHRVVGTLQKNGLKPGGGGGAGWMPVLSLVAGLERAVGALLDPAISTRTRLAQCAPFDDNPGAGQFVGMAGLAFEGMVSIAAGDGHCSHTLIAPGLDPIPGRHATAFTTPGGDPRPCKAVMILWMAIAKIVL